MTPENLVYFLFMNNVHLFYIKFIPFQNFKVEHQEIAILGQLKSKRHFHIKKMLLTQKYEKNARTEYGWKTKHKKDN